MTHLTLWPLPIPYDSMPPGSQLSRTMLLISLYAAAPKTIGHRWSERASSR